MCLCPALRTPSGAGSPAGPGPPGHVRLRLPLQRVPRRLLGSVWAHAVAGGGRGCGSGRGLRDGRSPPGQGLSGPTLARPLTVAVPSLCPTANEGSGGGPSGSVRPRREWPAAESTSTHRSAQGEPGAAEAAAPLPPGWGAARTRRVTPGSVPLRRGFLPPWR